MLEAPDPTSQDTTVAIAGMDGYARVKAHFTARAVPYAPDAAVVLAPEAHVVAGVVYFVDGAGVVRAIDRSGQVRQAAVFPMTQSQQEISFAVSPDGAHLAAAILTLPALGQPVAGEPWTPLVGPWKLEVDRADFGGPTVTLHQWQAATEPSQPGGFADIVMAGWDAQGPVAAVGGTWATQNPVFDGQTFYGGHFANVDMGTGLPGLMLGTCQDTNAGPWSIRADGARVCAWVANTGSPTDYGARVSVEVPGQALWQPVVPQDAPFGDPGSFALSADARQLAMDGAVVRRSGSTVTVTEWFAPEGWLDATTLIGLVRDQSDPGRIAGMAYVQLANPSRAVNLGFVGTFVGMIN